MQAPKSFMSCTRDSREQNLQSSYGGCVIKLDELVVVDHDRVTNTLNAGQKELEVFGVFRAVILSFRRHGVVSF